VSRQGIGCVIPVKPLEPKKDAPVKDKKPIELTGNKITVAIFTLGGKTDMSFCASLYDGTRNVRVEPSRVSTIRRAAPRSARPI